MMPIAMITGIVFHQYMDGLAFLTPYLIAMMLLITYCNISIKSIRFSRLHIILLAIQICASVLIYFLLLPVNHILAQAAMVCVFAPTATSAPVITGMLGGNVESLTAYSLLSNMAVVVVAPLMFAMVGEVEASSFTDSLWVVFQRVFVLLFVPLIGAILLKKLLPRVHYEIQKRKSISFYLWSIALTIITGKTVQFIIDQEDPKFIVEISIAVVSFIICISQFLTGRAIGRRYDNTIAGGQGLGQKNTVLAIWMAQTFLNPISSIGPGAYVLWQNIVNSYQVWRKRKQL
jgi:BASS family bile acid:Na+ symporter